MNASVLRNVAFMAVLWKGACLCTMVERFVSIPGSDSLGNLDSCPREWNLDRCCYEVEEIRSANPKKVVSITQNFYQ